MLIDDYLCLEISHCSQFIYFMDSNCNLVIYVYNTHITIKQNLDNPADSLLKKNRNHSKLLSTLMNKAKIALHKWVREGSPQPWEMKKG